MGEERGPAELLGVFISSGFCKIHYWKKNIEGGDVRRKGPAELLLLIR